VTDLSAISRRISPARCVFHTLKECVGYHTLTEIFVCGTLNFRKSLTEIPRNGCGTMRAAAVSDSPQSPPTGGWPSWRVLARPRPVCKNIWREIGDCHVTAAARIVPHPFLGISVSDFRKFKCTRLYHTQKNCEFVVSHTLFECVGNATCSTESVVYRKWVSKGWGPVPEQVCAMSCGLT